MSISSKLSIRPTIDVEGGASNPAEKFQNETLRPILKLQNDLLIELTLHFLQKRKIRFDKLGVAEQKKQLQHSLTKDNSLRNQLLGTIIGHFTLEEWATYQELEMEARRRVFSMLEERLIDQMLGRKFEARNSKPE